MLTIGGQILCSRPGQQTELQPGVVQIHEGRIHSIDLGKIPASIDLGGPTAMISPGFVDTHLHLPQFESIGVAGMPLLKWLDQAIFPAEIRWNDADFAANAVNQVARELLSFGTTGVGAYATSSHAATLMALDVFQSLGFRGIIGQVLMDCGGPPELTLSTAQAIDELRETLHQFPADGRIATAITPRFALSCSQALLDAAGKVAAETNAFVQTHLAETETECREVRARFGDRAYTNVYADAGLLTQRTLLGHGIYLDSDEQRILNSNRSVISHCPTANDFLGSGIMNRKSHLDAGLRLSLGSDVGAGYERSMVRVGRAMILTAMKIAQSDPVLANTPSSIPTAAQAWYQITTGNAETMGWLDGGKIAVGNSADLVVIHPNVSWLDSVDPLSTLMFAWDDRWIRQTVLRGEIAYATDSLGAGD